MFQNHQKVSSILVYHALMRHLEARHLSWVHGAKIHEQRLRDNLEGLGLKALLSRCPYLYEHRHQFREWVAANRVLPNEDLLTCGVIKTHIASHYAETLSMKKVSRLLHLLCFDFGRLQDSYFEDRRKEPFVHEHLVRLIPILKYFLDHPEIFLVWFGDATFIWSNNPSPVGLRDLTSPNGDGDHRPQAGVGIRLGL